MLEGDRVRLRAYTKDDLSAARDFLNVPKIAESLRPGTPYPLRMEDEHKWYDSFGPMNEKEYNFAIERTEDELYIGGCGFAKVDWKNSYVVVGIFLGLEYCGQGYGADAMQVLMRFAFEEMNVNKVQLDVFSNNERAICCYLKLGFMEEGRLRQTVFRRGKHHDTVVMGILREEWNG